MLRSFPLLVVALLVSGPVSAVDLTGVWEGGFKCTEFDGEKVGFTQTGERLYVSQIGNELRIEWDGVADLQGVVVEDFRRPYSRGGVALIDCETNTNFTSGYGEMGQLQAKIDRDRARGTLKGTGVYTADGEAVGTCKWKFYLVSLADPVARGCE